MHCFHFLSDILESTTPKTPNLVYNKPIFRYKITFLFKILFLESYTHFTLNQCFGSVWFWYGSGSGSSDPFRGKKRIRIRSKIEKIPTFFLLITKKDCSIILWTYYFIILLNFYTLKFFVIRFFSLIFGWFKI